MKNSCRTITGGEVHSSVYIVVQVGGGFVELIQFRAVSRAGSERERGGRSGSGAWRHRAERRRRATGVLAAAAGDCWAGGASAARGALPAAAATPPRHPALDTLTTPD